MIEQEEGDETEEVSEPAAKGKGKKKKKPAAKEKPADVQHPDAHPAHQHGTGTVYRNPRQR